MDSNTAISRETYDVIYFEALGPEARHLDAEIMNAVRQGLLPVGHNYLITPDTLQSFLATNPDTVLPRLISIKTHSIIPDDYLTGEKNGIITRSAGYDHMEHLTDYANIASLREYCVNAVAQTAIKFVYATAGMLNHYGLNTLTFERKRSSAFMELGSHRVLTVYGVGKIGKRIYDLAAANGLTVQGVDVRQEELNQIYDCKVKFVSREEAVTSSDIIVNAMNLTRNQGSPYYNVAYFSKEYLLKATKEIIFINVTRGEIASEDVLLDLYLSGRIVGLGLDVFSDESEFANRLKAGDCQGTTFDSACRLIGKAMDRSGNIYIQPHQAFNSDIAAQAKAIEAVKHVASWYRNGGNRFDEQLPCY